MVSKELLTEILERADFIAGDHPDNKQPAEKAEALSCTEGSNETIRRLTEELNRAKTLHFNYVYEVSRIARQEAAICEFPETNEVRALIDNLYSHISPAADTTALPGYTDEQIKAAAKIAWPDLPAHWWERQDGAILQATTRFAAELAAYDRQPAADAVGQDEFAPYLKEGETPIQRLKREISDSEGLSNLLIKERRRFEFLHSTNSDKDGWEWGVARVRRAADGRIEYLWGVSDHSDIDAAMGATGEKGGAA